MIGGALERFGVHSVQVAASPAPGAATRATHLSPLSRWDEPTRERVRESMQRIYDLFIARVAEGRAMPAEQVRANAEGAIFLATSGKERGLVDELGGVARALELARQLGGLPSDVRVTVEGGVESVLEALLLGPEPEAGEVEAALARFQRARAAEAAALAPGAEELLRPFAAAVAPLLAGESVVAALPYSLTLR
jgi:protease-4